MHQSVREYIAAAVAEHGPFRSVCEVGCRDINGSIRDLFDGARYVGVDILDGDGVDVVADFATWSTDDRFDCVVTSSVLEHTASAKEIIIKACRLLTRPGVLIVTCAGPGWRPHSAIDENPIRPDEYYENVDAPTLATWIASAGFDTWKVERLESFADTCAVAFRH